MALPVDSAGLEVVPLEALPSGISPALPETATSPGTGSGDSESVFEGQSTDANTATVNPEVSATSLNHGQHNHFRMLTTKRSELVIIIIATCIALAGLILQFKANRFSDEANELTRQGNSVAEKSYKLQLWDDCHDRQDLQNSTLCRSASSLIRRDLVFRNLQHIPGEMNRKVLASVHMTFHGYFSLFSGNLMDLWHCAGFGLLNILLSIVFCLGHVCWFERLNTTFCMVPCYVCASFISRDITLPLFKAKMRRNVEDGALCLLLFAHIIPLFLLTHWGGMSTGPERDKAYVFVLMIVIGLCWSSEKQCQRLRKNVTVAYDEEALVHQKEKLPDYLIFPDIGRETHVAYVQKLKRRLRTYVYQQDN